LAGAFLVDTDAVFPSYVDAMVRAVEELGPYMVVAPGIALAHARPEDGGETDVHEPGKAGFPDRVRL